MPSDTPTLPKLLLTAREAAALLSISERTLWGISQPRGSLPVVRISKAAVRYDRRALERWINQQQGVASGE